MNIAMEPEAVMAAARQNDANTAESLGAAQRAVQTLVALRGNEMFGPSPAGQHANTVFGRASTVIDDLITEVTKAIDVLNRNLHSSVDAVLKGQEVADVDYTKLAKDNDAHISSLDTTGIKPGEQAYQKPVAPDPASQPASTAPATTGMGATNPATNPAGPSPAPTTPAAVE